MKITVDISTEEVLEILNKKEPCCNKVLDWECIQNKRKELEKIIED